MSINKTQSKKQMLKCDPSFLRTGEAIPYSFKKQILTSYEKNKLTSIKFTAAYIITFL